MLLSCEKVALLSGSIFQQLSVITLYLWQITNTEIKTRPHGGMCSVWQHALYNYTTHSSGLQPSGFISFSPVEMAFTASELPKWL